MRVPTTPKFLLTTNFSVWRMCNPIHCFSLRHTYLPFLTINLLILINDWLLHISSKCLTMFSTFPKAPPPSCRPVNTRTIEARNIVTLFRFRWLTHQIQSPFLLIYDKSLAGLVCGGVEGIAFDGRMRHYSLNPSTFLPLNLVLPIALWPRVIFELFNLCIFKRRAFWNKTNSLTP